ncbi:unnamed protein product [Pedinophyceae sp. YPF-701]|nr:unnamed protein product [Pedinophyceae sp. YPF-701]
MCSGGAALELVPEPRGSLSSLVARPVEGGGRALRRGEVEVEVRAVGINFRDVLNVLGMYPGDPGLPGADMAGVVVGVGEGCVAALGPSLTFAEGAACPTVMMTVDMAVGRGAGVRRGERVLVHAGAGGVGLTAVAVLAAMGARVASTAGSAGKRGVVRGCGAGAVAGSRDVGYAEAAVAALGGVDVVVNSLTSAGFVAGSVAALAAGGRVVEIGKRDVWSAGRVAQERADVRYGLVAVDFLTGGVLRGCVERVSGWLGAGAAVPLRQVGHAMGAVAAALRQMSQARHVGKVVVVRGGAEEAGAMRGGSMVVSGGAGYLGSVVGAWACAGGCREVVLVARTAHEVPGRVAEAARGGAGVVRVVRCDMGCGEEARAVVGRGRVSAGRRRAVGGVVHAAGVLADATVARQSAGAVRRVAAPKGGAVRAWGAHGEVAGMPCGARVVFSSVAALLGSAGQANYAAANAALDAWAEGQRRAGVCAGSVQWGAWAGEGMAMESTARRVEALGMGMVGAEAGLAALEGAMRGAAGVVAAVPFDWTKVAMSGLARQAPVLAERIEGLPTTAAVVEAVGTADAPHDAVTSSVTRGLSEVTDIIRGELEGILGVAVDPDEPLMQAGLDSLSAMEFQNNLEARLDTSLPPTVVFNYPTTSALAAYIVSLLRPSITPHPGERRGLARALGPKALPAAVIVSSSGSVPGGSSGLFDAPDGVTTIPLARYNVETAQIAGPLPVPARFAGLLQSITEFDCPAFSISPAEATVMDPHHRLLLMHAGSVILDSCRGAQAAAAFKQAGVFVATASTDFANIVGDVGSCASAYAGTGSTLSPAAGRISFKFDLAGPALVTDVACSSALVALELALADMASGRPSELVGATHVFTFPRVFTMFSAAGMLAVDGRCKALDADAAGYVRAEAVVMLSLLAEGHLGPEEDARTSTVAVRSAAINQDGRSSSLTAPSGPAQEAVIRAALARADIRPEAVTAMQMHGTGTPLGDPIELGAIHQVAGGIGEDAHPLVLQATKLSAPILHLRHLNPYIATAMSNRGTYSAPRTAAPLPSMPDFSPLSATSCEVGLVGVNAFAYMGTNAFCLLGNPTNVENRVKRPERLLDWETAPWLYPLLRPSALATTFASHSKRGEVSFVAILDSPASVDLWDHRVRGRPLLPAAAMFEAMAQAPADADNADMRLSAVGFAAFASSTEGMLLVPEPRGSLSSLVARPVEGGGRALRRGEVEVEVRAVGINFRDVLNVLGMYPGDPGLPGADMAGVVVGVGEGVRAGVAAGSRVVGLAVGSLGPRVRVAGECVAALGPSLTFAEGAACPTVMMTVDMAVGRGAGVRRGERVLVHAGAGGVGLTAVAVLAAMGARVASTAGSAGKRGVVRGCGAGAVAGSRDVGYAEAAVAALGGVDVVVNSLTSAGFVAGSVAALAAGGRVVEIGKRDVWSAGRVAQERADVRYGLVAVDFLTGGVLRGCVERVSGWLGAGAAVPLRQVGHAMGAVAAALRQMSQARHVGKVVVVRGGAEEAGAMRGGSMVVSGGAGYLGSVVGAWACAGGCREVVLVARTAHEVPGRVAEAARGGAGVVRVVRCDMGCGEEARAVVGRGRVSAGRRRAVGGVVHAAGVLADATVARQSAGAVRRVAAPKGGAVRAWGAHGEVAGMPCGARVVFSSVAALLGSAGQANYAAANAALDAWAEGQRRAGVCAGSVQWGAWAGEGMAMESTARRVEALGMGMVGAEAGLAALEGAMRGAAGVVAAVPFDWGKVAAGQLRSVPLFESMLSDVQPARAPKRVAAPVQPKRKTRRAARREQAAQAAASESEIEDIIRSVVRDISGTDIGAQDPFMQAGADSLAIAEMLSSLENQFGVSIPQSAPFDHPTPAQLAEFIASLGPRGAGQRSAPASEASESDLGSSEDEGETLVSMREENAVEDVVQQIIDAAHVVSGVELGPEDPFMQTGLDSLSVVELKSDLEGRLGVELPTTALLDHPNARRLAEAIVDMQAPAPRRESRRARRVVREKRDVRSRIASAVESSIEAVLGGDDVDMTAPLMQSGLDSLGAVELANSLETQLGVSLPATTFFDYPTPTALVEYLVGEVAEEEGEEEEEPVLLIGRELQPRRGSELTIFMSNASVRTPRDALASLREADGVSSIGLPKWTADADWTPAGSRASRFAGLLGSGVDDFDTAAFLTTENEAQWMDPSHRLLLFGASECILEATADRSVSLPLRNKSVGIYIGISAVDFAMENVRRDESGPYTILGSAMSPAAGRIAFMFGFKGPAIVIDTACSSSLVALHLASAELRSGRTEASLYGGVNVIINLGLHAGFSQAGMLAADGRCKTLDAGADGYVRSEACVVAVLRAGRAGDGGETGAAGVVVRGSAVNQDGRSSSLTAPNGPSQQAVMTTALEGCGVRGSEVGGLQMHGTGTALGDPIEMGAVEAVLVRGGGKGGAEGRRAALWVMASKSWMGHSEPAAGSAGIHQAASALSRWGVAAVLHLREMNGHCVQAMSAGQYGAMRGAAPAASADGGGAMVMGVSGFAFMGTNAHVVMGRGDGAPAEGGEGEVAVWETGRMSVACVACGLAERVSAAGRERVVLEVGVARARLATLWEHRVRGRAVMPAAGYMEMIAEAGRVLTGDGPQRAMATGAVFESALILDGIMSKGGMDGDGYGLQMHGGAALEARLVECVAPEAAGPVQLVPEPRGSLSSLVARPVEGGGRALRRGEVEVEVRAVGINFRDVLNVLGMYPGDPGLPGADMAGVVVGVGEGVRAGVAAGSRVVGLAVGSLGPRVRVAGECVAALGPSLTFAEGAACPTVMMTVDMAVGRGAGVRRGERVLVHAGAGGVGLTAVAVLAAMGARVASTAGSAGKRGVVRGCGAGAVAGSRDVGYAEAAVAALGGVDVVVNSLTSAGFVAGSVAALAAGGRVVEIGKRDVWSAGRVAQERADVRYGLVAVDFLTGGVLRGCVERVSGWLGAGAAVPLRQVGHAMGAVAAALRQMSQARHVGKVVVVRGGAEEAGAMRGGSMVVVLVARTAHEVPGRVAEAARGGAGVVRVVRCDMGCGEEARAVVGRGRVSAGRRRAVGGVVHAAGVLADATVARQSAGAVRRVAAPKGGAVRAWGAHGEVAGMPCGARVVFSSVAALLGSAGQANYAAANAALDAWAEGQRRAGVCAGSVQWGAWAGEGMAMESTARRVEALGMGMVGAEAGLAALEGAMRGAAGVVAAVPFDWAKVAMSGLARQAPVLAEQRHGLARETIEATVMAELGSVLGGEVSPDEPLMQAGLDSLGAVELANNLEAVRAMSPAGALDSLVEVDAVVPVPLERWNVDRQATGGMLGVQQRFSAMLSGVDAFDAMPFGLSREEAAMMDPQHRLLLMASAETVMDAGGAESMRGYGVFVGISTTDYSSVLDRSGQSISAYSAIGNALSAAAGRVAFSLNMKGPTVSVDTACSSSLVGLHIGMESMARGRCDGLLAGGVNLMLMPDVTSMFLRSGMLSADGRCKTLDAGADGYVRSEACVVAVRRAGRAGDGGEAGAAGVVVRGSAVNQDGRSSSLTAPNGPSQQAVMTTALEGCGVRGSEVGGLQMHGTGTALGDPIEMGAVEAVLVRGGGKGGAEGRRAALWVMASKSWMGHSEPAAGSAGIHQAASALSRWGVAAVLHLREMNGHCVQAMSAGQYGAMRGAAPAASADGGGAMVMGVSGFAFMGTNAHVVMGRGDGAPAEGGEGEVAVWETGRMSVACVACGLAERVSAAGRERVVLEVGVARARLATLWEHRVRGRAVMPAAGYMEMIAEAGRVLMGQATNPTPRSVR